MEMTQTMTQKQTQKLMLTVAMKQSLQVLQMPQEELYELVSQELKSNPMLEVTDGPAPTAEEFAPVSLPVGEEEIRPPEDWDGKSWVEQTPGFDNDVYRAWNGGGEDCSPLMFASREQDFGEMLREQLAGYRLPPNTAALCDYLVDCLDERGYLDGIPEEMARQLGVPLFEVMQAIYFFQSLSPVGVGARTLEECLILQLVQSKDFNAYTVAVIKKGLGLLADNKIQAIAKLLKTDTATAQEACDAIRRLNPVPTRGYFTGEKPQNIIPDAVIQWEGDHYRVKMNDSFVPRLEISRTYRELLDTETDEKTVKYIRENMSQASALIRSIDDRGKTLFRVIECVIGLQPSFFRSGRGLLPMTMKDVAEVLELDVSTISRTVQEKYIVCGGRTMSLRALFTSGYATAQGDDLSSVTVKEKIKEFVAAEGKSHPLSDEDIKNALESINIKISRRTVAKYRDGLGIPSFQHRRR